MQEWLFFIFFARCCGDECSFRYDVRMVGIWGIGGVGKTTIARAIFDTLSYQFKAACFLADDKENARKNQLHYLQNILLSELLRKKADYVNNKLDGKCMIPTRLCSMKVLIVLDDIDHSDHLEYLAGDLRWFGDGSRVVITTRNRQLIENDDAIYEVSTLPDDEAMLLFNQHAFKKKIPDERFKMMSLEVVNHAKGLPLALKVWGSLLHRKDLTQWRRIVDKIKDKGYHKTYVLSILERSYNIGAECGLEVLIGKSLVFISGDDRLEMHDLIEDMGRYVVKMQKDLGEYSRIWDVEDFEEVMLNNTYLPNSLCLIDIYGYPWESLPEKFEPKRLVHLELRQGSLRHLWFETKHFPCLRRLNLSDSQNLMQTPDFSGMPNLEHLYLLSCESLKELHYSLGNSRKLIRLDLWDCESLKRFPCVSGESLEYLNMWNCSSLEIFPEVKPSSIQYLIRGELLLSRMKNLVALPSSICKLKCMKKLDLSRNNFEHLPRSVAQLGALRCLDVSHCKRLTQLPEFPVQLDTIEADWTNYRICNSLFRNLSLLQHGISASDSLSLRVITSWRWNGMPRFSYQGIGLHSVILPKKWYIHDSFLGFAVCYPGILTDITAHLIHLSDDGMSCITRKLVLSIYSKYLERNRCHFFLIPFSGLWDISKASGKTPNDYSHIMLSSSRENEYEFRLLYKDELGV
ncbi:putative nudix hydrolase 17, mitochondrial-like [Capsicum annuum]|nr:putative nudix hydrolase 17, mitochondrial-like [Capsicum annuum]